MHEPQNRPQNFSEECRDRRPVASASHEGLINRQNRTPKSKKTGQIRELGESRLAMGEPLWKLAGPSSRFIPRVLLQSWHFQTPANL